MPVNVLYQFAYYGKVLLFFISVYEKWLRRRLNYAVIRETGNHAAPGFIHTILHSGSGPMTVASEVRAELWRNNKYPYSNFFQHGQVLYGYPPLVKELLQLRFPCTQKQRERCRLSEGQKYNFYNLSLKEMATVPDWLGPLVINTCPYPHTLETPLTWTLAKKPDPDWTKPCPNPQKVNTPVYPTCCHGKDNVCSAVYCRDPMPETVYIPGPMGRGEAHFKWHLNHPEGKGRTTIMDNAQKKAMHTKLEEKPHPCGCDRKPSPCG